MNSATHFRTHYQLKLSLIKMYISNFLGNFTENKNNELLRNLTHQWILISEVWKNVFRDFGRQFSLFFNRCLGNNVRRIVYLHVLHVPYWTMCACARLTDYWRCQFCPAGQFFPTILYIIWDKCQWSLTYLLLQLKWMRFKTKTIFSLPIAYNRLLSFPTLTVRLNGGTWSHFLESTSPCFWHNVCSSPIEFFRVLEHFVHN